MGGRVVRWILTGSVLLAAVLSGLAWTMVSTPSLHSSVIAYTQLTGQAPSARISVRLIDVRTRQRFTPHPDPDALNTSMDWSPDGERLAYVAAGGLGVLPAIYTIRPDGTDQQVIMDVLSSFLTLRWSPDGRFLIFVEFQGATSSLQVVDVETRRPRPLLDLNVIPGDPPDWSPEGEFIVYLYGETLGDYDLVTVDVLTGRRQVIDDERSVFRARWSPTGEWIAYEALPELESRTDIFIINPESGETRNLSQSQFRETLPSFSPDGSQIAYISETNTGWTLNIADPESGAVRVIDSLGLDISSSWTPFQWSPDGQAIAYVRRGDIYVIQLTDESVRRLTTDQPIPDTGGRILWRPE